MESHLLQMRGLKPQVMLRDDLYCKVASFTDAWIETYKEVRTPRYYQSHLLQMRGLKL